MITLLIHYKIPFSITFFLTEKNIKYLILLVFSLLKLPCRASIASIPFIMSAANPLKEHMKNLYLSHNTALSIYKEYRIGYLSFNLFKSKNSLFKNSCISNKLVNRAKNLINTNNAIDILINNKNSYHKNKQVKRHLCSIKLPNNAFRKISNNIFIISPEFLFCQMASTFSVSELLIFGMEICGTYVTNKKQLFTNNTPLTSAIKILAFCKNFRKHQNNFKGIKKAVEVASMLKDNSASPKESVLYSALASPRKWGGFNIKNLNINKEINISSKAKAICNQNYIRSDLSIAKSKIAIEYDSDQFHSVIAQNRKDKKRINALLHDKWKIFTFLADQLYDINRFKTLAIDILKANLQSARIRIKNFDTKSNNLLKALNTYC